jgi:enoyl-CoA hydratase/carnithine racemase
MTYLLPRIVGLGRALHLALSAEQIDADEALRIGLVTRVVEPDRLLEEAVTFAHRVGSYPRVGVGWTKRLLYEGQDLGFDAATQLETRAEIESFLTPETRARFQAFVDRKR